MRRSSLVLFPLLFLSVVCLAAETDPVFDLEKILATPLDARVTKSTEADGIVTEEVMFHSEMDGDKSVDIFGFFAYPKGAEKLPALIWSMPGAAPASTYWTDKGAKRGYATLCIDLPMPGPGYRSTGGYPISSNMAVGEDPTKAPIYHGAVAYLKAVSFLETRKQVDKDRIGMAGSSWGGFFTTLMPGIDPRLKAGSAMFGCGCLQLGSIWFAGKADAALLERWRTTLDPGLRLPRTKAAMAWFSGTNDNFFWMPALMASCEAAGGKKSLTLQPNYDHGLPPVLDEQVFVWLDAHLKGAPAFIEVTPIHIAVLKTGDKPARPVAAWSFNGPRAVKSAELILSYGDAGNWKSRYWATLPAEIVDKNCLAQLLSSPMPYYISGSVLDGDGFRYSTPIVRVAPEEHGLLDPKATLDYDGCAMWGDFEEAQVTFLTCQAWMTPTVSNDAHSGKQSIVLTPKGRTAVRPIYFTPEITHRFSAWLKADKEVEIKVQLAGTFDDRKQEQEKTFKVGTEWTEVTMDYTPPKTLFGVLQANFTVPDESKVLLDSVSFRPVAQ